MASCDEAMQALIRHASGYAFHNVDLLREALDTTGIYSPDANRRLAMIGEARLKDVVLDDWYPTGATKDKGTQLASSIGSNSNLALAARKIGLHQGFIVPGPNQEGGLTIDAMATVVQAILGAIYWDSKNEQAVRRAMIQMRIFA